MTLRADHVAGAAFLAFGAAIIALSGDLPTGQLSMPGSGFLPKIVATLLIIFGLTLILRGRESAVFSSLDWSDLSHATQVLAIAAIGVALYTVLGFLAALMLTVAAILLIVERRRLLPAGIYTVVVVVAIYVGFEYVLKTPLPTGPWGF